MGGPGSGRKKGSGGRVSVKLSTKQHKKKRVSRSENLSASEKRMLRARGLSTD